MLEYTKIEFAELQKYETFESKDIMDENIYLHIERLIEADVPSSVVEVLRFFGRSSLRVYGVSFAKYQTIANALNVSKRTVLRAVKTLVGFGVIDRIPTLKGWRRSVNVVQILPLSPQHVTPTEADEPNGDTPSSDEIKSESFSFKHLKQNHLREDKQDPIRSIRFEDLTSEFIPKNIVIQEFVQVAKPFFNAATIYKLWGTVRSALKKCKLSLSLEAIESIVESFKTTVFLYKANRIKSTFENYFFGVLRTELSIVKRREVVSEGGILIDWRED